MGNWRKRLTDLKDYAMLGAVFGVFALQTAGYELRARRKKKQQSKLYADSDFIDPSNELDEAFAAAQTYGGDAADYAISSTFKDSDPDRISRIFQQSLEDLHRSPPRAKIRLPGETEWKDLDRPVFSHSASPRVQFEKLSRAVVLDRINFSRPRNQLGGLDWTREEYIAYALARPVPVWSWEEETEGWNPLTRRNGAISDDMRRTIRFQKHEDYANDNIDYKVLAQVLWDARLVSVDGKFCRRPDFEDPPAALIEYVKRIAPWSPKPPSDDRAKKAA